MPHHSENFVLSLNLDDTARVCQEAIANIGWRVFESAPQRIVCKESAAPLGWTWPVQITITLNPMDDNTSVAMEGSIGGWGPVQAAHCRGQVGNLRNRIEVGAKQHSKLASQNSSSLADELQRLAELYSKGILSDQEFNQAKQKLLG